MDIAELDFNDREYEQLVFKHDPAYADMNRALVLVKKFITDNNLIIYGGTAIDMALRLHGDKIYPDDLFPDLDFYSKDNVKHSYELADILYKAGFTETRAINAAHMKTMRIDLTHNHFIADISYQPKELFDKIPYLVFDNMRIVHPMFQRIDMHSALSFPYDSSPREVIFARWSKDVKRFNMLDKYYPVEDIRAERTGETSSKERTIPTITFPLELRSNVFNGFVAYAFLYHEYEKLLDKNPNVIVAELTIGDGGITCTAPHVDIVTMQLPKGDTVDTYEPLGSILPARCEYTNGGSDGVATPIIAYSTKNRLLSINSVKIGDVAFRIVNIQYLLRHFMSLYFAEQDVTYMRYYESVLLMIECAEKSLDEEHALHSPFFPSVYTYGADNLDPTKEVLINRMYAELDGVKQFVTPWNYYPARSIPKGLPHPAFDINSSEFYRESGCRDTIILATTTSQTQD